jgi:hypothetical protein
MALRLAATVSLASFLGCFTADKETLGDIAEQLLVLTGILSEAGMVGENVREALPGGKAGGGGEGRAREHDELATGIVLLE